MHVGRALGSSMDKPPLPGHRRPRNGCLGVTAVQSALVTVYAEILVPQRSRSGEPQNPSSDRSLLAPCREDSTQAGAIPHHAEVCAPFGWGTLSPIQAITARHLLSPRSSARWPFTRLATRLPGRMPGRPTGLPSSTAMTWRGGCCLSTGGAASVCTDRLAGQPDRLPFGSGA